MSAVGNNIKKLRESKDMSQDRLAEHIGVTRSSVCQWEKGKTKPKMGKIEKLSSVFGVPVSEIVDDTEERKHKAARYVTVQLFGSITAGMPTDMESADDAHEIPEIMHLRYPDAFLLRVDGESMNRVLPNGSYALVNPVDDVEDGRVYAVCINGYEATVKRVRKLHNGVELQPDSDDPTFSPLVYDYDDHDDELTVIGRIVWYCIPYDFEI